jgi:hypothetical protein
MTVVFVKNLSTNSLPLSATPLISAHLAKRPNFQRVDFERELGNAVTVCLHALVCCVIGDSQ